MKLGPTWVCQTPIEDDEYNTNGNTMARHSSIQNWPKCFKLHTSTFRWNHLTSEISSGWVVSWDPCTAHRWFRRFFLQSSHKMPCFVHHFFLFALLNHSCLKACIYCFICTQGIFGMATIQTWNDTLRAQRFDQHLVQSWLSGQVDNNTELPLYTLFCMVYQGIVDQPVFTLCRFLLQQLCFTFSQWVFVGISGMLRAAGGSLCWILDTHLPR